MRFVGIASATVLGMLGLAHAFYVLDTRGIVWPEIVYGLALCMVSTGSAFLLLITTPFDGNGTTRSPGHGA